MTYQPLTIANMKTGLEKDIDSFLIAEDAFPVLNNAYLWRGRVYTKGGTQLLGRLGVRLQRIDTRGAPPQVVAGNLLFIPIEPGSLTITDGITTFTDNGVGGLILTSGVGTSGTINYTTGAYSVTFNAVNAGAAVIAKYFVKVNASSPVMGLRDFEVSSPILIGLMAFDMVSAYTFNPATSEFEQQIVYKGFPANTVQWTGSNSDFFYSTNFQNAFFATNNTSGLHSYAITNITNAANAQITIGANNLAVGDFVYINNVIGMTGVNNSYVAVTIPGNPVTVNLNTIASGAYISGGVLQSPQKSKTAGGDGIRWWDGTGWVNFQPIIQNVNTPTGGTPQILQGALLILPYKGYLVVFNTLEGQVGAAAQRYPQRARWSQLGLSYPSLPVPAGLTGKPAAPTGFEWNPIPGRGGFVDAPTSEAIVAAEFIKDTLVVFFENSTWRFTFTGNTPLPFIWEKINTELGAESTFSTIPFDRNVFTVGRNGIFASDSVNIERIDRMIPDVVFNFNNANQGHKRVQGIRNYFAEMAYWTYVDPDSSDIFPNRMLVYNYITNSFSIFFVSFTCLGSFNSLTTLTWGSANQPFSFYNYTWGSQINQSGVPLVIAGNQQGFVFLLQETDGSPFVTNAATYVIQAISAANPSIFTSINHNFSVDVDETDPAEDQYVQLFGAFGGPETAAMQTKVLKVLEVLTPDTFTLVDSTGIPISVSDYTYGGFIRPLDNFNITTKNLNPYFAQGQSVRIGYADLYVDNEVTASVTINTFNGDIENPPIQTINMSLQDSANTVRQTPFWKRVYFSSYGPFIALQFCFSQTQMFNFSTNIGKLTLHGMLYYLKTSGRSISVRNGTP